MEETLINKVNEMEKNLKKILTKHKITLKSLSVEVGIPASTIHGWMNGVPPKNIHEVKKIADFLGVTIDVLCFGTVDEVKRRREKSVGDLGGVELILRFKE